MIISIGTDSKILDGGRVYDRVKEYSNLVNGQYFCFVFTENDKIINFEKCENNLIVRAIYGKNKFQQIWNLYSEVRKVIKSQDYASSFPDREVIWYPQDSFEIGTISLFLGYIFGGKLYIQCHTDISHENFRNHTLRNYFQYLLAQIVFRKADKIRVVSNRMKKYLVEELAIDESKILSLPIYFDLKKVEQSTQQPQHDFLIMSRLEPEKNIETAILTLQEINQKRKLRGEKELSLKIVGDGSLKKSLQNKFNDLEWILWEKWSTNPTQEYLNTKLFLLPSLYEGWGLTAIESVSCGTPVVMTNVGCAHEVIKNFENGVISEGFDVSCFGDAILKALNTNFSKEKLHQSVIGLDTKEEYLVKLKKFLNK